jgi:hypothetical protein
MTDIKGGQGLQPMDEFAELDTTLGHSFELIYDKILSKSLKEYLPLMQRRIEDCEADRAARLQVMEKQGEEFAARLFECEADRAARLDVIERQAKEFTQKIDKMGDELVEARNLLESREAEIEEIKLSTSWKITAPLRWISGKIAPRGKS